MKTKRLFLILSLIYIYLPGLNAQNNAVNGIVLDMETKKPLPFVNIVYNSKNQGLTSNMDGKFSIKDLSGIEFLKFNYLGYVSKTINKEYLSLNPQITVYLIPDTFSLSEVVVYPGENPAHRIIKKVLENRELNNPDELDSYSYNSYNKMIFTADLDNVRKKSKDSIVIPDSAKVDSGMIKAKKLLESQHLFLMESVSERYYKKPGKINEKVIATRVSGFKEPSFVLLATQMQSFSFYNEMITLMDSRYVSPISTGSTSRYFFKIEDTTYTASGDSVFSISFRPKKNKNFEGLKGLININTNGYAIQNVVAEPVDNNGMVDLKITQNYELINGRYWFPVELNTDIVFAKIEAQIGDNYANFVGVGKSYLSDIKINPDLQEIRFKAIELNVEDAAFKQKDSIWNKFRRDSLTAKEMQTYKVVDSIGEGFHFDRKLKLFKTISTGYIPFHFIDINVLSILDFNVFEGFRPGLGIRTNDKISKFFTVGAFAAYGFRDKQWKYGGNLNFILSKPQQIQAGIGYKHDVIESSGFQFFEDQITFNSSEVYRNYFISDMTYIDDYQANFSFRALKHLKFNLFAHQFTLQNTSDYQFYRSNDFDLPRNIYHQRETGIQVKFAPNENYAFVAGELFSLNPYHSPVMYFNIIRGFKDPLSDFDYLKLEAKIDINFMTKTFGRTSLQISGAKVYGDLPYFMLYNGHESYYDFSVESANSFATMRMNEFLSDEFVSLHYQQDFGGLLFKGKKFRPKIILANSVGFGRLSKPELHQALDFKTLEKGYYESGLIINNIVRQLGFIGYGFGVYYRYGPYSFTNINDNFAYKLTLTFEL